MLNRWLRYWTMLLLFLCLGLSLEVGVSRDINDILIHLLLLWLLSNACWLHKPTSSSWHIVLHLSQHRVNLELSWSDNLVCNCLFHEIHLALPYDFHQLVWQRNCQLWHISLGPRWWLSTSLESFDSLHASSLSKSSVTWCCTGVLRWRIHQERVVFAWEIDVLREMRLEEALTCITFHLEEIVLVFPYKWDVLELFQMVALCSWSRTSSSSIFTLLVGQQEVIDKLLSPLDYRLHNVKWEHS